MNDKRPAQKKGYIINAYYISIPQAIDIFTGKKTHQRIKTSSRWWRKNQKQVTDERELPLNQTEINLKLRLHLTRIREVDGVMILNFKKPTITPKIREIIREDREYNKRLREIKNAKN